MASDNPGMILMPLLLAATPVEAHAAYGLASDTCAAWASHAEQWSEAGATARAEGRADIAKGGAGTDAVIALMNKKADYLADRAWLGGYLAGAQRRSARGRPDLDSAYDIVTRYCSNHPRASVVEAAARVRRGRAGR